MYPSCAPGWSVSHSPRGLRRLFARTPEPSYCAVTRSTIRVGAAVGWVRDHSVDGRVTRSAPDEVAVALPGGKIERMRVEPEERLMGAAEFGHLSKTSRIASWTRRSGSFSSRLPALTKPTGAA